MSLSLWLDLFVCFCLIRDCAMTSLRFVAIVASVLVGAAVAQYQCTYTANINITAPDIAPARFLVSAYDCCRLCSDTDGCVASIYTNYYCHLKGVTQPQVVGTGPTLILQLNVPPSPPTTATTTTKAPAPPTTNAPAPTTSVPSPTTDAPAATTDAPTSPPPATTVTIVREVACQYSDTCSRRSDYSCYSTVYFANTCQQRKMYSCGAYHITWNKYSEDGCKGTIESTEKESENVCVATPDETYVGHYCDVQQAPTLGLSVSRTICPYGCNDGSECQSASFVTGTCLQSNPFSGLSGSSVMAWCFPEYVVYAAYGSIDCSGEVADARSEPIGQSCFLDNNQEHIQNVCG